MARALIVGCGCCARLAGAELLERGWVVRGSSRDAGRRELIAASGIEAVAADPDRVGSIVELVGDVTVLVWALGAVEGGAGEALQRERLPSLLEKLVDTPVRGLVWESPLPAGGEAAERGRALLADAEARWRLPTRVLESKRSDSHRWALELADAVESAIAD